MCSIYDLDIPGVEPGILKPKTSQMPDWSTNPTHTYDDDPLPEDFFDVLREMHEAWNEDDIEERTPEDIIDAYDRAMSIL